MSGGGGTGIMVLSGTAWALLSALGLAIYTVAADRYEHKDELYRARFESVDDAARKRLSPGLITRRETEVMGGEFRTAGALRFDYEGPYSPWWAFWGRADVSLWLHPKFPVASACGYRAARTLHAVVKRLHEERLLIEDRDDEHDEGQIGAHLVGCEALLETLREAVFLWRVRQAGIALALFAAGFGAALTLGPLLYDGLFALAELWCSRVASTAGV